MFSKDDLIIYGSTGVCRVSDITPRVISEDCGQVDCYVLKPLYRDCTISVPVNCDKIFMRPIISREEAERLVDTIPNVCAEAFHCRLLKDLTEHYDSLLKTYDCACLIKLSMSIYAKKQAAKEQKRKLGAVDERFLRLAEDLLFGELAAALCIPKDSVPEYISERLGRQIP